MGVLASELKIMATTNGLGGAITATEITSAAANNLFDLFSGAETAAGGTFYACVYALNDTVDVGNPVAQAVEAFVNSEDVHAGVTMAIGLGTSAVNGTEQTITDENTAPAGVTFFTTADAEDIDDNLIIGDIPADQHKAIWIRMVIDAATAAKANFLYSLGFKFDSVE